MKRLTPPLLALAACAVLSGISSSHAAYSTWTGGNGAWEDAGKWTDGVPDDEVRFNTTTATNEVTISSEVVVTRIDARQRDTTLLLSAGASLTASNYLWIGQNNTGGASATGHVTFQGPTGPGTATVTLGSFNVGHPTTRDGNSLTFTGPGLNAVTNTALSIIGRGSGENLLSVTDGASLAMHSLRIGGLDNVGGNRVEVKAATLEINSGVLEIGATVGAGVHHSALAVSDGGTVEIKNQQTLRLSYLAGTHGNAVTLDGTGSKLVTSGLIAVGASSRLNEGNNRIFIGNGARLESTGAITLYGHNLSGPVPEELNALVIASGGTLVQTGVGGTTTIGADTVLRLAAGGALETTSLTIEGGGRFEAAGSGFNAASATIRSLGTLAVGAGSGAENLAVSGNLVLESGSRLELNLFEGGDSDRLVIEADGSVNLGATLVLSLGGYTPIAEDSWTLLVNNGGSVAGNFNAFDLPTLGDGLSWNLDRLNAAGGWEVSVIPEPGTWALLALGACAAAGARRWKR